MQKLKDKVALVTGGSRGIGAAIVKRLAREGATVSFTYVNSKKKAEHLVNELSEEGLKVVALKADNAVEGEITSAIEDTINRFGCLDILINNAGIYIGKPFEEHTLDDYDKSMAVNVRAVVEACLIASRKMKNPGRIITIGSNMAERVPSPQGTIYSMSKSALIGFTKGLARDLGPKGICVNLIQPGSINTDMNPEDSDGADFQRSIMAVKEYGKPEDIAHAVIFLASSGTSYNTGAILTIDGGGTC